jgi:hypothetical protein
MRKQPADLHADYREAFGEWAQQVRLLQSLGQKPGQEEAEARVAAAEMVYRQIRDRLSDEMEAELAGAK